MLLVKRNIYPGFADLMKILSLQTDEKKKYILDQKKATKSLVWEVDILQFHLNHKQAGNYRTAVQSGKRLVWTLLEITQEIKK